MAVSASPLLTSTISGCLVQPDPGCRAAEAGDTVRGVWTEAGAVSQRRNLANHYGRPPTLVEAGTGVVIAAEFRKMCLPRNPATTTAIRSATTITATAVMATRLPRPILTLLTILSIAGSLSMMAQSAASIMPMAGTDAPSGNRLQILRDQSQAGPPRWLRRR